MNEGNRIAAHYSGSGMAERLLSALTGEGMDIDVLSWDRLTSFDQFHTRGLSATRDQAALATPEPGEKVIDIGCGVGGPARHLAAEFHCESGMPRGRWLGATLPPAASAARRARVRGSRTRSSRNDPVDRKRGGGEDAPSCERHPTRLLSLRLKQATREPRMTCQRGDGPLRTQRRAFARDLRPAPPNPSFRTRARL